MSEDSRIIITFDPHDRVSVNGVKALVDTVANGGKIARLASGYGDGKPSPDEGIDDTVPSNVADESTTDTTPATGTPPPPAPVVEQTAEGTPPPPPASAPAEPPHPADELDSAGYPYDARIHVPKRTKRTREGDWTKRPGIVTKQPGLVEQVQAEYDTAEGTTPEQRLNGIIPNSVTGNTPPDEATTPATPDAPAADVPDYQAFVQAVTTSIGKGAITPEQANAACVLFGIKDPANLQANPEHIPSIAKQLGIAL